jgi:hypothetical protein
VSSRDLRRQATSLLRLADKMAAKSRGNAAMSRLLAERAQRQMQASSVALDLARRQLSR